MFRRAPKYHVTRRGHLSRNHDRESLDAFSLLPTVPAILEPYSFNQVESHNLLVENIICGCYDMGPFAECHFALIISRSLPEDRCKELATKLESHGADNVHTIQGDADVDLGRVTHIIAANTDFAAYNEARKCMLPVVNPTWITQSLLRNKLAPLRPHNPDPRLIFSNVTLTCGDIPPQDRDALIGAVLAMGGMESDDLTRTTTHVCSLTMDHPKVQQALAKHGRCRIVLPHWFDDCLKLGKRIDETPYVLPDPLVLKPTSVNSTAFPDASVIEGAVTHRPSTIAIPRDASTRALQVFNKKNIMLSDDLGLGSRLRDTIEDIIRTSGGSVTNSIRDTDMYVCQYRDGKDYVTASRAGIDVGNLAWLYYLITNDEWTSPLRRLLHYPVPRNGVPGFENFKITLSNYGGDARLYLENLVIAAGGEFTKSMKQENTHLITARKASEKCTAAAEWNINMINHLWLEESYAKCQVQRLTDPRYTHFPTHTNLGEVIGQVQMDPELLERSYFPRSPTPSPGELETRRVMHDKDRNSRQRTSAIPDLAASLSASKRKHHDGEVAVTKHTPVRKRHRISGKENDTPSSTGSRGAKDKAIANLHGLASDITEYEKENKRKGSIWGGDRAAHRVEREQAAARSSSPLTKDTTVEGNDACDAAWGKASKSALPKAKGGATAKQLPPTDVRLLVTGYQGWVGNACKEDAEKRKLRDFGIQVTTNPAQCTHMAAPSMVRTQKFLCGLANGPTILSTDFIDACIKTKQRPAFEDYVLRDAANEKKFKLKLHDVIEKARSNRGHLLRGVLIYCTSEIENGCETYKAIVEANGGTFLQFRSRGGAGIKPIDPDDDPQGPEPVYLLTSEKAADKQLWPKFREMAKAGNTIPRIVQTEWLLDTAMSQQLCWDDRYLAKA